MAPSRHRYVSAPRRSRLPFLLVIASTLAAGIVGLVSPSYLSEAGPVEAAKFAALWLAMAMSVVWLSGADLTRHLCMLVTLFPLAYRAMETGLSFVTFAAFDAAHWRGANVSRGNVGGAACWSERTSRWSRWS